MKTLLENLQTRRSYYQIGRDKILTDDQLEELVKQVVLHTPSAFNSQTTRVVLLLGEQHEKLWDIVESTLKKIVPADKFAPTKQRIKSFCDGYGTVLFFEDYKPFEELKASAAAQYAEKFPQWSEHTAGMHQLAIWTLLEDAGYGASLQHYNPIIDDEVKETWNIPGDWKFIAQMPFGSIKGEPGEKEFKPIEDRVKVYR